MIFSNFRWMGGRGHKSIKNYLDNLEAYWEIDTVTVKGVSKSFTIAYARRSVYKIVTINDKVIPMLMCYSSLASN